MPTKIIFLVISATLALAAPQDQQGAQQGQGHHVQEGHVGYEFAYGVQDPHTHDIHSQKEHREGKNVVGEYTIHDPDGTQRVVKYVSGPHSGFEAIVERQGHAQHPPVYGKHVEKGGKGGTSYVGVIHWSNQGESEHHGH